jgi:segregation and condensation protein A
MWNLLPYEIDLPVFRGPLDLLLHLIEREELDISVVSLAQVTEQYLEHLSRLEELEAGALADFLVVAARLIWIKSRVLLPQPTSPAEKKKEEDPGETLARQLRAYRQFKMAAEALREREQRGLRAYVRIAPSLVLERRLDMGGVSLADLVTAMQQVLAEKPAAEPGSPARLFTITINDKIALTGRLLREQMIVRFRDLLERATNRAEVVVTLWAVLELIKREKVTVEQSELFGEIVIRLVPGTDLASFESASTNGAAPEPALWP